MTKIFELNKNLFKVDDNYVCVEENPSVGDIGFIKIGISGTVGLISYDEKYHTWDLTTIDNIHYPFSSKKYLNKIVFSTQFIHESIPVLNIEDGESIKPPYQQELDEDGDESWNDGKLYWAQKGFKEGYQKAKETFKYTEEDLFDVMNFGNRQSAYLLGHSKVVPESDKEFIQSLQQPKDIKSVEVEWEFTKPNIYLNEDEEIVEDYPQHPIVLPNGKIKCKINY